jgi:DNA-binding response OmpR family regulator
MRIALLEDDTHLAALMTLWIEARGHDCEPFTTGDDIVAALGRRHYDLAILDWLVPGMDGEEVLKWIREHLSQPLPVIFVTQREAEEDVVRILTAGADDYITKPVSENVLLARVNALARRSILSQDTQAANENYGIYTIDNGDRSVLVRGEAVKLTQKEFELACYLFSNTGRILPRDLILHEVWGHKTDLQTRTVDTHISRLRSKLTLNEDNGWRISAIYHHGYRLERLDETSAIRSHNQAAH